MCGNSGKQQAKKKKTRRIIKRAAARWRWRRHQAAAHIINRIIKAKRGDIFSVAIYAGVAL